MVKIALLRVGQHGEDFDKVVHWFNIRNFADVDACLIKALYTIADLKLVVHCICLLMVS